MYTVWKLYDLISRRLLRWSALSVLVGIVLVLLGGTHILDVAFMRGFGLQAIGWGLIDALIAQGGQWLASRRRGGRSEAEDDEEEARKLRRLLTINTVLDVFYVGGGVVLAYTLGAQDPAWRGHGWGIVAQGAFLFAFDLIHAQSVPLGVPRGVADLYRGNAEHEPFVFPAAPTPARPEVPAALMVHGYLGTPIEVRALGEALSDRGWAAHGLLLPGFGADIETLPERRFEDWLAFLEDELSALQAGHRPVLLMGYSMGGALALCLVAQRLAAQEAGRAAPLPDGLVLLAPFTQDALGPFASLWGVVQKLLPSLVRPMRWISLKRPHLRHSLRGLMPGVDLDDPAARRQLRRLAVPTKILNGLIECGCAARRARGPLPLPILVLQGDHDEITRPRHTRRLVQRLGPGVRYVEVDAGHGLGYRFESSWPAVEGVITAFADELLGVAASSPPA